jgi:hypothetical protein
MPRAGIEKLTRSKIIVHREECEEREGKQNVSKTKEEIERVAEQVVDAMLDVHRALGLGVLESMYQACRAHELGVRGIEVGCEVALIHLARFLRALSVFAENLFLPFLYAADWAYA